MHDLARVIFTTRQGARHRSVADHHNALRSGAGSGAGCDTENSG